jgi:ABC-type branched-subunit amino acid transport system ATPase component
MSELLINAQDLNTYYSASHILRDVNFTVGRGETIGLMGRNGMGKSTLLKSLMGIVPPRSGTVDIKGQRMNGRPTFEVAQMGIAYVPIMMVLILRPLYKQVYKQVQFYARHYALPQSRQPTGQGHYQT